MSYKRYSSKNAKDAKRPIVNAFVMCHGTHGGENRMCDSCAHNMENFDDENNKWEPEKYHWIDEVVCRLPVGGKYWTQYKAIHLDT